MFGRIPDFYSKENVMKNFFDTFYNTHNNVSDDNVFNDANLAQQFIFGTPDEDSQILDFSDDEETQELTAATKTSSTTTASATGETTNVSSEELKTDNTTETKNIKKPNNKGKKDKYGFNVLNSLDNWADEISKTEGTVYLTHCESKDYLNELKSSLSDINEVATCYNINNYLDANEKQKIIHELGLVDVYKNYALKFEDGKFVEVVPLDNYKPEKAVDLMIAKAGEIKVNKHPEIEAKSAKRYKNGDIKYTDAAHFSQDVENSKGTVYVMITKPEGCINCYQTDVELNKRLSELRSKANLYYLSPSKVDSLLNELIKLGGGTFPLTLKFVDGKYVETIPYNGSDSLVDYMIESAQDEREPLMPYLADKGIKGIRKEVSNLANKARRVNGEFLDVDEWRENANKIYSDIANSKEALEVKSRTAAVLGEPEKTQNNTTSGTSSSNNSNVNNSSSTQNDTKTDTSTNKTNNNSTTSQTKSARGAYIDKDGNSAYENSDGTVSVISKGITGCSFGSKGQILIKTKYEQIGFCGSRDWEIFPVGSTVLAQNGYKYTIQLPDGTIERWNMGLKTPAKY